MIGSLVVQMYLLADYFCTGGFVMVPLLTISLIMWILIIERALYLRRLGRKIMKTETAWKHICDNQMPDPRHYKGVIALLVARFLQERSGDHVLDRYILDEIVFSLNRALTDYLEIIAVLAALAPLLGLLGTVIGMIKVFSVIMISGVGDANVLAGGISQALITTAAGLTVAIPRYFFYRFFRGMVSEYVISMEQKAISLIDCIERGHPAPEDYPNPEG